MDGGEAKESLLLPKSIGDSQPRERRLPASSSHSREERVTETVSRSRRKAFFSKKEGQHRDRSNSSMHFKTTEEKGKLGETRLQMSEIIYTS